MWFVAFACCSARASFPRSASLIVVGDTRRRGSIVLADRLGDCAREDEAEPAVAREANCAG